MYISNRTFVNKYFSNLNNIDDVLLYLYIIKNLLKKYGKKLKLANFKNSLNKKNKVLYDFIILLSKFGKLNISSIENIISLLKSQYPNYKKIFYIRGDERILNDVENFIKDKFVNIEFDKQRESKLTLNVKGEGFYFKKSLSSDLDKVLKI